MSGTNQRGYTAVELLMAIAVMGIGLGGVIAMQKVTVSANDHSRRLALATHIAESWLDELTAESAQWNDTNDTNDTTWLAQVGVEGGAPGTWFRPAWSAARNFGPGFDALGNPVPAANLAADAHFCTDLRLRWLSGQQNVKLGSGLIRAEVRVFWIRPGVRGLAGPPPAHVCDPNVAFDGADGQRAFDSVYLSTTLRQHIGVLNGG